MTYWHLSGIHGLVSGYLDLTGGQIRGLLHHDAVVIIFAVKDQLTE